MAKLSPSRALGSMGAQGAVISTPPFPRRQMLVLAICRICEPIAFMGIFPYIFHMVKDFQITEDEGKISFYAGLITSAFTFAEFATGFLWGRLSDRIGRKPVLLAGLAGTALSVLIFGFAQNLWVALAARAIGGLLNGNMGVLQSTVAELVTVKEHQPRAYTIMPTVWCLGSIIGPMIGGLLAKPCDSYPQLFSRGTIWEAYPYLLPNLFSAFVVLIGVVNGLLFLEETHSERKNGRDRGLELGDWLLSKTPCLQRARHADATDHRKPLPEELAENRPLLASRLDKPLPEYHTNEFSPEETMSPSTPSIFAPGHASRIFTLPVILNVVAFGILAFHTMTFDQMFPVFLEEHRRADRGLSLPFKFVDGFGLDTKTTGLILSFQGIYAMVLNVCVIPLVLQRFGPLRLFRFLAVAYFALYLVTPYVVLLPQNLQMIGICFLLIWKCTFANMSYPSNAILTANAAPSKNALGTINGVAASTASLCRGFGPIVGGVVNTVGMKYGYSGLAWWSSGVVSIAGGFVAMRIPEQQTISEKSGDDIEANA